MQIQQLQEILQQLTTLHNALAITIGEITAICEQEQTSSKQEAKGQTVNYALLKEQNSMLTINDCSVRKKGKSFEVRFQKFGYSKSFTSTDIEVANARMREYLREVNKELRKNGNVTKKSPLFSEWAIKYLNNYAKINMAEISYTYFYKCINHNVIPAFGNKSIGLIKAIDVQAFLSGLIADGKGRTAETCKTFFNGFFETAMQNGIIKQNIMQGVKIPKHYRKHGTALTLEEEAEFISKLETVAYYKKALLFLLYTGVRGSELEKFTIKDVDYDKNTLTIHTSKQRDKVNGAVRVVPIFPKLKAVLEMPGKLPVNIKQLQIAFRKVCPEHHLHELRHTFTTRCRECGIDNEITSLWTGHTFVGNTTSTVYTHFSLDFQQLQAKKLDY